METPFSKKAKVVGIEQDFGTSSARDGRVYAIKLRELDIKNSGDFFTGRFWCTEQEAAMFPIGTIFELHVPVIDKES